MNDTQLINWLLEGDVSIQYQVHRDLMGEDRSDLQARIATEGWGALFLSRRYLDGHWGQRFYQPKWISTHYTLLDLRHMNLSPDNKIVHDSIDQVLEAGKAEDGGIPLGPSTLSHSDVCVNAMFLNYAAYFQTEEVKLRSIVDSILREIMPDGGFNCRTTRSGARHSSLHTTLSVLEGLFEFQKAGYLYRDKEVLDALESGMEFVLMHRLFRSDRTGKIIDKKMLMLSYPSRWKYDILRALDHFQFTGSDYDSRMDDAIQVLKDKRRADNTWPLQAKHPGQTHIDMEKSGQASRWNTLRALRVLKNYGG